MEAAIILILFIIGGICSLVQHVKNKKQEKIEKENRRKWAYNELNTNKELPWRLVRAYMRIVRDEKCEECGGSLRLQVHHKIPVRTGGDNTYSNLMLLCKDCHEKVHHVFHRGGFDNDDYLVEDRKIEDMPENYGRKRKGKKTSILEEAILLTEDVMIKHRKPTDETYISRRVTPKEVYSDNQRLYLRGYCHLRGAERTFRISRIKTVEKL
jgi:5-methylcytosine-specific restriction endonuclease McrA